MDPDRPTDAQGAAPGATDRRGFLRALSLALSWASLLPSRAGADAGATGIHRDAGATTIHRDTRNTRFGAIGRALSQRGPTPKRAKSYPGAERLPLPRPTRERGLTLRQAIEASTRPPAFGPEALSLAEVGRLLYHANGVTGEMVLDGGRLPLRAAPSAGALYAGEVYLAAERVEGLGPGVYYYEVAGHRLARVNAQRWGRSGADGWPAEFEGAAALVLLTNVFRRYTWRYANRGYRYALIDTGHIAENLRLAAASAGRAERGAPRFHGAAQNALIGVDGRTEAVCAVHAIGPPAGAAPAPPASGTHERDGTRMPVEEAIRRRRSARRFEPEPIPRASLDYVLAMARGLPGSVRVPHLELDLVVHRVEGLDPGLYRFDAAAGKLAGRRPGELSKPLVRACGGQQKAGEAAVAFLIVGRIARAAGERGYRDLLIESGAIAQRIYLAAESLRLAARNLAAFVDDDLNRLIGLDGRREAVLHLTVLGPGD